MTEKKYEQPLKLDISFDEALARFAQTDPKEVAQMIADKDGPVELVEHGDTGDRFLIYSADHGVKVELQVLGDTFWATQAQMAVMFGIDVRTVSYHLTNIVNEKELLPEAVIQESWITAADGKKYRTNTYSLDAVIAVGYRVSSKLGTMFRIWATEKLSQYLTKGFVIDSRRLKEPGNSDRISELREIIRDIRAAEANVYAELKRICAMCRDYDPHSDAAHTFYGHMQAKLYWAVVSHTPAEVLSSRADATKPNMGLQSWPNENIRQADAITAKNYLADTELRELNRLTTILLDIFEDQLEQGRLTMMAEASALLDRQLKSLNRSVLSHGGRVRSEAAKERAKIEYRKFDKQRRQERIEQVARELKDLKAATKSLPKAKRTK